jgi:predicted Zn finger-like uncharacterized protein
MGLITRCPACGTMFKVVADQLRISEGWVRCGHCAEIFDATADLRDESQIDLPTAPAPVELRQFPEDEPVSSGYSPSVHSEVPGSEFDAAPDAIELEQQVQALHEHPLDQPFELRRADTEDDVPVGPHGFSQPVPLAAEPELHDLSFVRQARRREFWRRGGVRAMLGLLAVLLAALLAGQAAYQDRDRLAAANPAMRPWLTRMCDVLRCRIGPPRLIDYVGIETSSFNKLRADTYRLNVTLKNQAPTPVAMPSLELTLTDSQDQAVLRRVLQPSEFAPNAPAINAGSDWSTSVGIAVNAGAAGARIAGYRVLAFYP